MKQYKLEHLDCANCAQKIEDRTAHLSGVRRAHVSFATQTLHVDGPASTEQVRQIVSAIDSKIRVTPLDEPDTQEHERKPGHEHNHEHAQSKLSLVLLIVSIATFAVSFLPVFPDLAQDILLVASCALAGYGVFWSALKSIRHFELDENLLMTIAVIAALFLGEFPEAALVCVLFQIGEMLEELAVGRSRKSIEALTKIRPDKATVLLADGTTEQREAAGVPLHSRIVIRAGERVPLDGVIVDGVSSLDTSALTGESLPRDVQKGDEVLSGMVNQSGLLTVETTAGYEDSAASRIIKLVNESSQNKGQSEKFISRFARVYTPIVTLLAVAVALLPPLFGLGSFSLWLGRALVFLVASCPCALVLSIPLGFFAGIGKASKLGVLVKGGRYIEALAKADTFVFDKTGTLTDGSLAIRTIIATDASTQEDVLRYAALAESFSTHPIAQTITQAYEAAGNGPVQAGEVAHYEEIAGMGIRAQSDDGEILCGSNKLMDQEGIDISGLPASSIYVCKNSVLLGAIQVSDTIKEGTPEALRALRGAGVRGAYMLTGDSEVNAAPVAQACALDGYYASLLPQEKVECLLAIKKEASTVAFVGDGINDAPVLAAADLGVAMGLGSDAAMEAADVVLTGNAVTQLAPAIKLARRTMNIIRFNIVFALTVKAIVLILATFGFAHMLAAVFADVGVSLLSVLNAVRILGGKNVSA